MGTNHKRDSRPYHLRRVTRGGGGGEVSPALFQKLEKSALSFRKKMP